MGNTQTSFSYFESIINTMTLAKFFYMLDIMIGMWTATKGPCVWILGSYVVRIWNCSRWGWTRGNNCWVLRAIIRSYLLSQLSTRELGVDVINRLQVSAVQDQASPSCHLSYNNRQCPLWMWANITLSLQMLI